jgi:hypothetical protein
MVNDESKPDAKKDVSTIVDTKEKQKMEDTKVTKWLKKNGITDSTTIEKFYKNAYYETEYLDEDAINEYVSLPGDKKKLLKLLKEKGGKETDLSMPELPEDTPLDLSKPNITLNGVDYDLPTSVPSVESENGNVVQPTDLTTSDWMVIAMSSGMLYGRQIFHKYVPRYPVLWWRSPGDNYFVQDMTGTAKVHSEVTYSAQEASLVSSGLQKASLSIAGGYGGFSAGVSGAHSSTKKDGATTTSKNLFIVGIWDYPRARIFLDMCTVVSPDFVRSVENALEEQTYEEKIRSLEKVFNNYGYIYPKEVILGGRLYSIHYRQEAGEVNENCLETKVSAAVSLKLGGYANAEGSYQKGQGEQKTNQVQEIAETMSFTAIGGDTLLANNTAAWPKTLLDPNLWEVIELVDAEPTINLLPIHLKRKVEEILNVGSILIYDENIPESNFQEYRHDFPMRFAEPPIVITNLRVLEMRKSHNGAIAITTKNIGPKRFSLRYEARGDSKVSVCATTVVVPRALKVQGGVDDGVDNKGFVSTEGKGFRSKDNNIKFETRFDEPPRIFVSICELDIGETKPTSYTRVDIRSITEEGFDLHYETGKDPITNKLVANWIAIPYDERNIQLGSDVWNGIGTQAGGDLMKPFSCEHHIKFPLMFEKTPAVIVGLTGLISNSLNVNNIAINVRAKDVTKEGFVLRYENYWDSKIYEVCVNWMAISKT